MSLFLDLLISDILTSPEDSLNESFLLSLPNWAMRWCQDVQLPSCHCHCHFPSCSSRCSRFLSFELAFPWSTSHFWYLYLGFYFSRLTHLHSVLLVTSRSLLTYNRASLVAQLVKDPPAMWETWVRPLGWEDPLKKGKVTHSSILAWRIPWTVWSLGSQRVGQLGNFHFHFSLTCNMQCKCFHCGPFRHCDLLTISHYWAKQVLFFPLISSYFFSYPWIFYLLYFHVSCGGKG